jgi:hypothetical protein
VAEFSEPFLSFASSCGCYVEREPRKRASDLMTTHCSAGLTGPRFLPDAAARKLGDVRHALAFIGNSLPRRCGIATLSSPARAHSGSNSASCF